MTLCVERAAICVKEIFSNQLTQKRRALPLGCSGRSLRSSDATEARQSDRARTKTRARPPICGLRRPVGVPNSPVSWRRKTPDTTKSDSRPSEPARLASSWPTRKAPRASRGPAGHQRRGAHHSQSRDDDNRDIRETHLKWLLVCQHLLCWQPASEHLSSPRSACLVFVDRAACAHCRMSHLRLSVRHTLIECVLASKPHSGRR